MHFFVILLGVFVVSIILCGFPLSFWDYFKSLVTYFVMAFCFLRCVSNVSSGDTQPYLIMVTDAGAAIFFTVKKGSCTHILPQRSSDHSLISVWTPSLLSPLMKQ